MTEQGCERVDSCNNDQVSFKAYFSHWLSSTSLLAPFTHPTLSPLLASTAAAVASVCTGGTTGTQCGFKWTEGPVNDGNFGVGPQMSALGALTAALVQVPGERIAAPVTTFNGGTSRGNPDAGKNDGDDLNTRPASTMDKVLAGIATGVIAGSVVAGCVFMVF